MLLLAFETLCPSLKLEVILLYLPWGATVRTKCLAHIKCPLQSSFSQDHLINLISFLDWLCHWLYNGNHTGGRRIERFRGMHWIHICFLVVWPWATDITSFLCHSLIWKIGMTGDQLTEVYWLLNEIMYSVTGLDSITHSRDMNLGKLWQLVMDREAWHAVVHGVTKSRTGLRDWTELNWICWNNSNETVRIRISKIYSFESRQNRFSSII